MTVRRLLAETDSRELSEWMAYERVAGPLGDVRGDVQAALIAATVANANRTKGRPVKVSECLLEWDRQPQTWQQQKALMAQVGGVKEVGDGDHR